VRNMGGGSDKRSVLSVCDTQKGENQLEIR
jgi:hypothetical protein